MTDASFVIPGKPVPKGSMVGGTRKNGTHFSRESNPEIAQWMKDAIVVLSNNFKLAGPLRPPYRVTLGLIFERPNRPTYMWPSKSDIDKITRASCDALTQAGVIVDDRHIVIVNVQKQYGAVAKTVVRVESLA